MEKISAEISAAEEASRRRLAERDKEAGAEPGAREAPTCVLAEEEKHVCATHGGGKPPQNATDATDGNADGNANGVKDGEEAAAEPGTADATGKHRHGCTESVEMCSWR